MEYSNSKGASHKHTTQVFKGLFAMATFPFTFEGKTIVMPRDIFSEFYFGKYEKVELESPRFMELWSVRSTDQVGARMALSTDIMNNLLYFQEYLGHGNIRMSFIDNNVFIAIKQSKFLEPNYKKSILEQESVDEFKFELEIISNIIKTFKLKQNK